MKKLLYILTLAAALGLGTFTTIAGDNHSHSAKATPKGGRLLEKTEPRAELVVESNRTVTVNFYDAEMKPVAATTQTATVLADAKDGKVKLELVKQGDGLTSATPLPAGEGYNVVIQFKQTTDAKPQNFRFKLDLATCGECKRAEYACICGH